MSNNEDQVAITFWGVRGSTPCANKENMEYGGNTTCVQVHIPDSKEILILDSGTGIRNLGNELVQNSGSISGRIFITHPHWDHIQGFPFFKPIYGVKNHFQIHMPAQSNGGCKDILAGHLTETFFPVTLEMIDANLVYVTQPQQMMQYEGYEVEYLLANHTINTAVYKIHVNGRQIVFCPDNEIVPRSDRADAKFYNKLTQFFEGADVLIHDAQYNLESYKDKHGWGHSAWETVVDFSHRAGIKRLFLTHHDPDSNDKRLHELDHCLQKKFGGDFDMIEMAREGKKIIF
ncbi:MAG TPA: MBL fold metallo-hydrolase [Balneolaceae bacterium]|nr:MBL fold metallo-hydrolase [Balneolaceae bacterium]